jgi:diaminohydroxyphosphoribosylaminopyrimidine deaminase / 5-amino-6-(5-phosphoribosylamino)uracil reductase
VVGEDDRKHMARALALAERGLGLASPNPPVGAVLVDSRGEVVGEGWHEGSGTLHAESLALQAAGHRAAEGTLYCTLEPCDHQGRTPPCTEAILMAGVARAVVAARDPNPIVDGRGLARLLAGGVEVNEGLLGAEAERLIEPFAKHVRTGIPLVTLKLALSLDGKTASHDGSSRWITGPEAREEVHRMRAGSDAVMVGAGTALADDPALTVRLDGHRGRPPLRVLVDASGRVPPTGRLFDGEAPTLVATTGRAPKTRLEEWRRSGADVWVLEEAGRGGVDLGSLLAGLGKRDAQSVLLEGGPTLAWSAVTDGLVDRFVLFLAPLLVGGVGAPGALGGDGFAPIARALRLDVVAVDRIGPDLRVEARVHRDR